MTKIITAIQKALSNVTVNGKFNASLVNALNDSNILCKADYPIALINAKKRMEKSADTILFENKQLFNEMGLTPTHPSELQFNTIADIGSKYLQRVSIMCLDNEPQTPPLFQVKRQNDYWKKIQDVSHIKAMLETSEWHGDVGVCAVEFSLREIIRKRKEVHALKDVGFIWIAVTSSDVSEVFKHYFHDNYCYVKTERQGFHIGWSSTLRAISMRSFVCPPN